MDIGDTASKCAERREGGSLEGIGYKVERTWVKSEKQNL